MCYEERRDSFDSRDGNECRDRGRERGKNSWIDKGDELHIFWGKARVKKNFK